MRLVRAALILGATLVASLATAGAARADGPVITPTSRIVTTPIPFGASCGEFQILFTADAEGTNTSFYDDQSQLVRQISTVSFTGQLYNSNDLSKTVRYDGHFARTLDTASNTVTFDGLRFRVQLPGQGTVAVHAGQSVIDILTGQVSSEAGPGLDQFVQNVCPALS